MPASKAAKTIRAGRINLRARIIIMPLSNCLDPSICCIAQGTLIMDDFADKDGCLFHFRQLSEFTCSSLKKCINIQRLPEASGEPANGLFLFGALGGILKQPDIVNCQANLIRHIEDKLLVYFAPGSIFLA